MTENYVVVSFSGGKDSTAMLLRMIEMGDHIDEVITADTGMEFPEMYDHIARVDEVLQSHGIKHTTLRAEESFEYKMLDKPIDSAKYGTHNGFGWPTSVVRWCTAEMKTRLMDAHLKELRQDYNLIQCVGLAADETKRLERERAIATNPTDIHLLNGDGPNLIVSTIATTRDTTGTDCMVSSIGYRAGVVHWHPLENCVNCGNIALNCGSSCKNGMILCCRDQQDPFNRDLSNTGRYASYLRDSSVRNRTSSVNQP